MKNFFKRCVVTYPWVVASSIIVPGFINESWDILAFCGQLLVSVVTIFLLQLLTNRFVSTSFLLAVAVEFTMVTAVVYAFGWFWKWYTPASAWMMVVIILPVYILAYIVGIARTKKDIEYINDCLKKRKADRIPPEEFTLEQKKN